MITMLHLPHAFDSLPVVALRPSDTAERIHDGIVAPEDRDSVLMRPLDNVASCGYIASHEIRGCPRPEESA